MLRMILAVICLIALTEAAAAARCPHGEILRVHMGRCVSVYSPLAHAYVRLKPAPPHHRLSHGHCDPRSMCGDPIEDRVIDAPSRRAQDPPQTGGTTPRDDWTPPVPELPIDAFVKHGITRSSAGPWWR